MKKRETKFNLKDAFASKGFNIAFSIVIAIILWAYVSYSAPNVTVTVHNIPVDFVGEERLADNNLVLTGVDENVVTLDITGARSVVTKLTNTNVKLTADLSNIILGGGSAGGYQLQYSVEYPSGLNTSGVYVKSASSDYISVTVEKLVTKTFEVTGINDCSTAEGYQSAPLEFDPETITVSGPEAVVNTIDSAQVTIAKKNVSKTVTENADIVLIGNKGQIVPTDKLTLSQKTVNVTLPVIMVKEVALTVNFIEGASAKADNIKYTISPSVITISGDAEKLEGINNISLGTVDLTSFATTYSAELAINLPNDLKNISGETKATVEVQIPDMSLARISASNIKVRNVTEGYDCAIITQSLDVLLRGPEKSVNSVKSENIRIVADLTELNTATGTFSVTPKVYIDGFPDVDAIDIAKVSVVITESAAE